MTARPSDRDLLRRLVKAWTQCGGYAIRPAYDDLHSAMQDARALLAEPEGGVGATYEGRPWRDVFPLPETVQTVASTPRSRAEGSDLSVDQGREFRVVDGLGDNNRAGKVTIDPTLLSPPTPRSRAEAEVQALKDEVERLTKEVVRRPSPLEMVGVEAIATSGHDNLRETLWNAQRTIKEGRKENAQLRADLAALVPLARVLLDYYDHAPSKGHYAKLEGADENFFAAARAVLDRVKEAP